MRCCVRGRLKYKKLLPVSLLEVEAVHELQVEVPCHLGSGHPERLDLHFVHRSFVLVASDFRGRAPHLERSPRDGEHVEVRCTGPGPLRVAAHLGRGQGNPAVRHGYRPPPEEVPARGHTDGKEREYACIFASDGGSGIIMLSKPPCLHSADFRGINSWYNIEVTAYQRIELN